MTSGVTINKIDNTLNLSLMRERAFKHEINQSGNNSEKDKFECNKKQKFGEKVTDKNKLTKYAAAGASLGALLSVIYINKKRNPNLKADSFKNLWKMIKPDYDEGRKGLPQLLGTAAAAVAGGFIGSYPFVDDNDKKSLIRESIFQLVNMNLPTSLVALSEWFCEKKVPSKYQTPAKIGMIGASVFGGVYLAVKLSDFLKRNVFEKDVTSPPRRIEIKNFFVHADDLFGILLLTKVPFVKSFNLDTIIPFLYARAGYEVSKFDEEH